MKEHSIDQQLRYLTEISIKLRRIGFDVAPIEDCHLTVSWNGCVLCRISGFGSVAYRPQDVEVNNAQAELQSVIDMANMTSEYMAMLEYVPQLRVNGLEGDYRVLADFGDSVLVGHPSEYGVRFVVWGWDHDRKGVHHGRHFLEDYEAAKRDFTVCSGLVPGDAFFAPEQLTEIYRALVFVREQDDDLSIGRDRKLQDIMKQIRRLLPEGSKQEQIIEQTM